MPRTIETLYPDRWRRYERYEVRDGYIRPASDRFDEYFPWDGYEPPTGKEPARQPYHQLLDLLGADDMPAGEAIEAWCSKHGLLGILLHCSQYAVLPTMPRTVYARGARGWYSYETRDERLVPGAWMWDLYGRPMAAFEPLDWRDATPGQFDKLYWMSFFPSLKCPDRLPGPLTKEFWQSYAEPVGTFISAVKLLRRAIKELAEISARYRSLKDQQDKFYGLPEPRIHALTANVRPMLELKRKNRYSQAWAGGSLFSDLAMMVHLDFAGSRSVECRSKTCRKLFVTNSTAALYCSTQCRAAAQKRRYRARHPEKEKEQ